MEQTIIEIPSELQNALKDESERSGRSENVVILEAVETYLRPNRRPSLRSFERGSDPELNGVDTEDWLTARWRPA